MTATAFLSPSYLTGCTYLLHRECILLSYFIKYNAVNVETVTLKKQKLIRHVDRLWEDFPHNFLVCREAPEGLLVL